MIFAAILWQLLQHLGGFYIDHELKRTQALYGFFALVLGLLAWLYLGAQLTIFAAEINVVRVHASCGRAASSRAAARRRPARADVLGGDRGARGARRTSRSASRSRVRPRIRLVDRCTRIFAALAETPNERVSELRQMRNALFWL